MVKVLRRAVRRWPLALVASVAVVAAVLAAGPTAAGQSISDDGKAPIVEPVEESSAHTGWPESAARSSSRSLVCGFWQRVEWPHRSGADVSVHGYWEHAFGWCPPTAVVTVWLQQRECSTPWWCHWVDRAVSSGEVREGGGSGKRVTARVRCTSSQSTKWRGAVDVDLVGYYDDPLITYGDEKWVNCRVS